MIITIDGPAGSGKSTAARLLAERLGFRFLDTGAMYRVVAWKCLQNGTDLKDEQQVARVAQSVTIDFKEQRAIADSVDVSEKIRTPEVTDAASVVALNPAVRRVMDARQRELAAGKDVITEGRDQGTVVFPDADCKFFLTANAQVRARRRQQEMGQQGRQVPLEKLIDQIQQRDRRDAGRAVAPLRPADNAIEIDTSNMSIDDMLDILEAHVRRRMSGQ